MIDMIHDPHQQFFAAISLEMCRIDVINKKKELSRIISTMILFCHIVRNLY